MKIEPGVKFFVDKINQWVGKTLNSCEGHPEGFYISFFADEKLARFIHSLGFFNVELSHFKRGWRISLCKLNERNKESCLKQAMIEWKRTENEEHD